MPILTGRQQIVIKQEAAAGTAEALALADVVMHTGIAEWEPDIAMTPREAMSASMSPRGSVAGAQSAKIRFKIYLGGTTGAPVDGTNDPEFSIPLQGCGVLLAVSGAPVVEQGLYTPSTTVALDDTTGGYCTVALYQDGKIYKIHGAVGNCKFTCTTGQPVLAEFEFTGVYNAPVDGALLVPVYTAIVEPAFLDAALSVLTYATAKIQSLTLDLGNTIAMRPYANNTAGFFSAQITGRNPTGSFDPEEVLAAAKNWYGEWLAGTTGAITTGVFPSGGTNYNQLQLTIPKAKYTKVGLTDREGIATAPVEFECLATLDAGEDEWSLTQT